ncbi:oxygen-dependent coproporphyrinogen oxidase [Gammaproteobacteria bacterium]|nr:oxygen-dependent coproporphyrinogen oxidase [Gammaproteobacteria bacterium]
MNKLDPDNLNVIEACFKGIQKDILNRFKLANNSQCNVVVENWKREQGGGGKSVSLEGTILEKAAVNFSSISGNKLPASSIASSAKLQKSSEFHAVGVSVISHPHNPFCPTSHMNVRLFLETGKNQAIKNWWIGGGFDLTPYQPSMGDASIWHNAAKGACDKFNKTFHKKFAAQCDSYFYLPHRKEKRGIGGIFFDQLQYKNIETSLQFLEEIARTYIDTYESIINSHKKDRFSTDEKNFQLYRRGRYVEFNLLFDRGTKFGIESNGRAESILASLPPSVNWPFKLSAEIKAHEKKLLKFLALDWNQHL